MRGKQMLMVLNSKPDEEVVKVLEVNSGETVQGSIDEVFAWVVDMDMSFEGCDFKFRMMGR